MKNLICLFGFFPMALGISLLAAPRASLAAFPQFPDYESYLRSPQYRRILPMVFAFFSNAKQEFLNYKAGIDGLAPALMPHRYRKTFESHHQGTNASPNQPTLLKFLAAHMLLTVVYPDYFDFTATYDLPRAIKRLNANEKTKHILIQLANSRDGTIDLEEMKTCAPINFANIGQDFPDSSGALAELKSYMDEIFEAAPGLRDMVNSPQLPFQLPKMAPAMRENP